jgi:histone acetyltransferase
MESKLENNHYNSIDDFISDAQLIFENCLQYVHHSGEQAGEGARSDLEEATDGVVMRERVWGKGVCMVCKGCKGWAVRIRA